MRLEIRPILAGASRGNGGSLDLRYFGSSSRAVVVHCVEAEEGYSQVSIHVFGCVGAAACDGAGYGGHVPAVHGCGRVSQHEHSEL